jgi:hypothetical protein
LSQDWHINFAGSSVYYHILGGSKIYLSYIVVKIIDIHSQTFLFVRPMATNLAAYECWSRREIKSHTWLGDMVDEVTKIDLSKGTSLFM